MVDQTEAPPNLTPATEHAMKTAEAISRMRTARKTAEAISRMRTAMAPQKAQLERYVSLAAATLTESMIVAAFRSMSMDDAPEADVAPRDETHDSIDAGTGMLTADASAKRAELAQLEAEAKAEEPVGIDAGVDGPVGIGAGVDGPVGIGAGVDGPLPPEKLDGAFVNDGALYEGEEHPAAAAANRELARAGEPTPEAL